MTKKLYTQSKVFIKNPYVVQVTHGNLGTSSYESIMLEYRKLVRRTRENMGASWGYSQTRVEYEYIEDNSDFSRVFSGNLPTILSSVEKWRSYWVFEDELDALTFTLSLGEMSRRVHMWPDKTLFTIFEITSDSVVPG